jgi:hypothetical protein
MDVAKLILEFVKALAWPVTAFVLALLFRVSTVLAWLSWGFDDNWKPTAEFGAG